VATTNPDVSRCYFNTLLRIYASPFDDRGRYARRPGSAVARSKPSARGRRNRRRGSVGHVAQRSATAKPGRLRV
jgi:hypothetical protein